MMGWGTVTRDVFSGCYDQVTSSQVPDVCRGAASALRGHTEPGWGSRDPAESGLLHQPCWTMDQALCPGDSRLIVFLSISSPAKWVEGEDS